MATNKTAPGDVFDFPATAVVTSGQPILMGDILGVAVTGGVNGDTVAVNIEGVYELAKRTNATTAAIAQGSKVYWDATNSYIDNTDNSAANKLAGYAFAAAGSTAGTVQVRLLG